MPSWLNKKKLIGLSVAVISLIVVVAFQNCGQSLEEGLSGLGGRQKRSRSGLSIFTLTPQPQVEQSCGSSGCSKIYTFKISGVLQFNNGNLRVRRIGQPSNNGAFWVYGSGRTFYNTNPSTIWGETSIPISGGGALVNEVRIWADPAIEILSFELLGDLNYNLEIVNFNSESMSGWPIRSPGNRRFTLGDNKRVKRVVVWADDLSNGGRGNGRMIMTLNDGNPVSERTFQFDHVTAYPGSGDRNPIVWTPPTSPRGNDLWIASANDTITVHSVEVLLDTNPDADYAQEVPFNVQLVDIKHISESFIEDAEFITVRETKQFVYGGGNEKGFKLAYKPFLFEVGHSDLIKASESIWQSAGWRLSVDTRNLEGRPFVEFLHCNKALTTTAGSSEFKNGDQFEVSCRIAKKPILDFLAANRTAYSQGTGFFLFETDIAVTIENMEDPLPIPIVDLFYHPKIWSTWSFFQARNIAVPGDATGNDTRCSYAYHEVQRNYCTGEEVQRGVYRKGGQNYFCCDDPRSLIRARIPSSDASLDPANNDVYDFARWNSLYGQVADSIWGRTPDYLGCHLGQKMNLNYWWDFYIGRRSQCAPPEGTPETKTPVIENAGSGCDDGYCIWALGRDFDTTAASVFLTSKNGDYLGEWSGPSVNRSTQPDGKTALSLRIEDSQTQIRNLFETEGINIRILNPPDKYSLPYSVKKGQ